MVEPWKTKEWEEKRRERITQAGGKCEWPGCNETEHLTPHHKSKQLRTKGIYGRIAYNLFLESKEFKRLPFKKLDVCPKCEKQSIYERKTITPKYRCIPCGATFETPKQIVSFNRYGFTEAFRKFKKDNEKRITELYNQRKEERLESYMNMENTIVLCRKMPRMWKELVSSKQGKG